MAQLSKLVIFIVLIETYSIQSIAFTFHGPYRRFFHLRSNDTSNEPRRNSKASSRYGSSIDGANSEDEKGFSQGSGSASNNINGGDTKNLKRLPTEGSLMSETEFEREVAIARAKAEIDAILSGSDLPFDLETELGRVTGGISPPLPEDSNEARIEKKMHELETSMYNAVHAGDYELAQKKKNELNKLHIDDCGSVLAANSHFYRAFSEKNYDAMKEVWLQESSALCIHPSHAPIVGARAVLESWKKMFASGNTAFQRNKMEPTNIRITVKGTTAVVTCDEEVYTKRFVRGRKRQDGMELVNKLIATNIFRKIGNKWYMTHHHASWHPESEAAKKALSSQTGGTKQMPSQPSTPRMIVRGSQRPLLPGINTNENSKNNDLTAEGVLGIPGHEGLYGRKKKGERGDSSNQVPGEKRIILGSGSLSDLLSGGLNDLLKGGANTDAGNADDSFIELIDESDDDDDDDETLDDDDDDDDDSEDEEEQDQSIIISNLGPGVVKTGSGQGVFILGGKGADKSQKGRSKGDKANGNFPKDEIRQNCISALRKLAEQGSISPKQKRVLLTDIIACSAKGEFSMVEVAYELLCDESDDKDMAENEFAEQCRIFASSLPEFPSMA